MDVKIISSYDEFADYIENYKGKYYFRGQKNSAWDILPALFRNGDTLDFNDERKFVKAMIAKNPKKSPLEALYYAQHYGSPTRICDLTINPLTALSFASDIMEGIDTDGVVYVIKKDNVIGLDSLEAHLFSTVLTGDSQLNDMAADLLYDILKRNYVIYYKDFIYSNDRAFRQGGTGIIFGFGLKNGILISNGDKNVDNLIVKKIIVPASAKELIRQQLRFRGISIGTLYGLTGEEYESENVSITNTKLERSDIWLKPPINKVVAHYKVSSVYFDKDKLFNQINDLYKSLFAKYGNDARIWTLFYFDELDTAYSNLICRGEWNEENRYKIAWNDSYHRNRLMNLNEEVSREDVFGKAFAIADDISMFYIKLKELVGIENYSLQELTKYIEQIHEKVCQLFLKASDVPLTDTEANKYVKKALNFICNVHLLIGEVYIYLNRDKLNEKWVRYYVESTLKSCDEKFLELQTAHEYYDSISKI